jgi:hypothetical protein
VLLITKDQGDQKEENKLLSLEKEKFEEKEFYCTVNKSLIL